MTVYQLFTRVGFESIMSALQVTHSSDKSIQSTAMYKQAFDKFVRLKPSGKGGEVTFDVTPREHWHDNGSLPLLANGVEGDLWEDIVGKEVVRPADNPFTDAELAGAILWGATFYGFTDHHKWNPFNKTFTQYGERAKALERKLYVPYIRDKDALKDLKTDELPFGVAFTREVWEEIRQHQSHQNRQKRKRFYRIKRRITHLTHLDKRVNNIAEIESGIGRLLGSLADKIIHAGSIYEDWRECHVDTSTDRVDYLIDLCTNYSSSASDIIEMGNEIIVVAYTSPENPLTSEESSRLQEYFKTLTAPSALHFLTGTAPDISSALDIQFICISDIIIPDDDDDY